MIQLLGDNIQRALLCPLAITDHSSGLPAAPVHGSHGHHPALGISSLWGCFSLSSSQKLVMLQYLGNSWKPVIKNSYRKLKLETLLQLMARRQKAALSIPLLSVPPSTIITIIDVYIYHV